MNHTKERLALKEIEERLQALYSVRGELTELWQRTKVEDTPVVTVQDIAETVSRMTGIPVSEVNELERERLVHIERQLGKLIIGQDHAITVVAQALRRSRSGLKDPARPIGSFLFLGPTGVGKTELAKQLARTLYGSDEALIRVDMSEFMEKHTVSRLIGAPPGYVGYDEGGQLTEMLRRRPYSVVLFDEIEKAHPEVFNILLQIMEDGQLTDGQGREIDFKNAIIIMTSNVGSERIVQAQLGFETGGVGAAYVAVEQDLTEQLRQTFRPEFLNRLEDIVIFRQLQVKDAVRITDIFVRALVSRLQTLQITLQVKRSALTWMTKQGFSEAYGARALRRTVQRELENPLSDAIIRGHYAAGSVITVHGSTRGLEFTAEEGTKHERPHKRRQRKSSN